MKLLMIPFLLLSLGASAQCKLFKIARNGDTLNCVDYNDVRQGKWLVKVDGVRGEPGYEEEGIFENGKKEGYWRVYTTMGDLFAVERYRWGNKDGKSQYFNIAGIVREESWKSVNPENPYDTIEVPDPVNPAKVEMKVVKLEGSAVKHGTWKYYENGTVVKTENYILNKLETPSNMLLGEMGNSQPADSLQAAKKPVASTKPAEVLEFEKKNKNKKKVKTIDGRTYQ